MRQTIILTTKQESKLERILKELIFSLKKTLSEEDLLNLSYLIIKESGKQTYQSKKDTAITLSRAVARFTEKTYLFSKNKFKKYKNEGVQNELSNDFYKSTEYLKKVPGKLN